MLGSGPRVFLIPGAAVSFEFDVFISYSRENEGWAARLFEELKKSQVECFLDQARLSAGEEWEKGLRNSLEVSQHIVVLWSEAAADSKWVTTEILQFGIARGDDESTRRMVFVSLDEKDVPFPFYQRIDHLSGLAHDPGKHANEVSETVAQIERAIERGADGHLVRVLALASTGPDMSRLDADVMPGPFTPSLSEVVTQLGIPDVATLLERYHETPMDWRPFGGDAKIGTLVRELIDELNTLLKPHDVKLAWLPVEEGFWGDDRSQFLRVARAVANEPTLILIDPLSLYDLNVKDRLDDLVAYLTESSPVAVLVVAPHGSPPTRLRLRSLVQAQLLQIHQLAYATTNPRPPVKPATTIGVMDRSDMLQSTLPLARLIVGKASREAPPAALDHGAGQ